MCTWNKINAFNLSPGKSHASSKAAESNINPYLIFSVILTVLNLLYLAFKFMIFSTFWEAHKSYTIIPELMSHFLHICSFLWIANHGQGKFHLFYPISYFFHHRHFLGFSHELVAIKEVIHTVMQKEKREGEREKKNKQRLINQQGSQPCSSK